MEARSGPRNGSLIAQGFSVLYDDRLSTVWSGARGFRWRELMAQLRTTARRQMRRQLLIAAGCAIDCLRAVLSLQSGPFAQLRLLS